MEKTTGAVSLLNLTAQAGLNSLPNIGKGAQSTGEVSFSDTFMKTSEVKPLESNENTLTAKKTVVETTSAGSNKNIKTTDNVNTNSKESLDDNKMKDIAEEVSKVIDEIKDKIKEDFSVSEEDIEKAMEVLGFTVQNLLNTTDLRSLVMELTETADSIELLTNVELYEGLKEVTTLADNLMNQVSEEFNLTKEQLAEVINTESFENILSEVNTTNEELVGVAETENTDKVKETANDSKSNEVKDYEVKASENMPIVENIENVEEIVTDNAVTKEAVVTNKTTESNKNEAYTKSEKTVEVEVNVEKTANTEQVNTENKTSNESMNQQTGNKKQNLFDNTKNQEVGNVQTITTQTVNSVGDVVEVVTSYSNVDAENIMRQVAEYVKVNITEDVTKMEMQLHPASLGTVNMQINSQNGQITAHLTVQNELVKAVLESQMVKLQETFNEQGTKVTAIEVSVANYNLDAKSDNNYSQERENNQGGSKRRSINLNEISSFDELTDEELLEAEVMEMNGSSVNYTV